MLFGVGTVLLTSTTSCQLLYLVNLVIPLGFELLNECELLFKLVFRLRRMLYLPTVKANLLNTGCVALVSRAAR